jgi:MFS family permease
MDFGRTGLSMSDLSNDEPSAPSTAWWRLLSRYQWLVLAVACLGWLFDTMDQQLFTLARKPAVTALLHAQPSDPKVDTYASYTTSIFIMGWGVGGLFFGVLGDRVGRVRTMALTILLYSLFTGLSAFSVTVWDFAFYRFLTGLGVGGEFAVGVSLVAEVMPEVARPHALAWLQASAAVGNMLAASVSIGLGMLEGAGLVASAWPIMFLVGALPAALAVPAIRRLREPERWQAAARADHGRKNLGSIAELLGEPRWRRNTLVGMMLAVAGVIGVWGIGFFTVDFVRTVFRKPLEAQGLSTDVIRSKLTIWTGITSFLFNLGALFGIEAFRHLTHAAGRRPAFALGFLLAMFSTAFTFWYMESFTDLLWMVPVTGFCQLTVFGLYAIYFPELFPTRLRSTGTSFCYNVGRFIAALGPFSFGLLTSAFADRAREPMRYAGVVMSACFLIGLLALPFAPETKGQPLPE